MRTEQLTSFNLFIDIPIKIEQSNISAFFISFVWKLKISLRLTMIIIAVERTTMRANTQTMIRYFTCSVLTVDLGCPSFSAVVMNSLPLCSKKKKVRIFTSKYLLTMKARRMKKLQLLPKQHLRPFRCAPLNQLYAHIERKKETKFIGQMQNWFSQHFISSPFACHCEWCI